MYQSNECGIHNLQSSSIKLSAQNISNTVTIGIPFVNFINDGGNMHCFVANASNGTYAASVQGYLVGGKITNMQFYCTITSYIFM